MGRDGGFLGFKDGAEVGKGHVMEWSGRHWSKGEGGTKVARKRVDEGSVNFMQAEVRLVASKEYMVDGGKEAKACSKLVDWQITQYLGWELERDA